MSKASNPPKPLSQHPMFPLVVAVWFAALFGLGSLVVRPTLLENAVQAAHLDSVVPAAAPPLGVTAQILLALVMAAIGSVLGLLAGNRLAGRADKAGPRQRRGVQAELVADSDDAGRNARAVSDAAPRRPLFAHQDLGSSDLDSPAPQDDEAARPARRRALSVTDETQPSQLLDMAPLPGHAPAPEWPEPEPEAIAAMPAEIFTPPPATPAPELDWAQAAPVQTDRPFDAPPLALQAEPASFADRLDPDHDGHEDDHLSLAPRQLFVSAEQAAAASEAAPEPALELTDAFEEPAADAADAVDIADAVAADPAAGWQDPVSSPQPEPASEAASEAASEPAPLIEPDFAAAAPVQSVPAWIETVNLGRTAPAPAANLAELGMVELADRLARAMQARRDTQRTAPAAQPASFAAPLFASAAGDGPLAAAAANALAPFQAPAMSEDVESLEAARMLPEDTGPVAIATELEPAAFTPESADVIAAEDGVAAAEPAPVAMPALFQAVALEDSADSDDADGFELPSLLGKQTVAPALVADESDLAGDADETAASAEAEEAEDEQGAIEACGSLLNLGKPAAQRHEFVRIENEPEPAAIEPVVIFPGHAVEGAGGPRPFDPPGTRQFDQAPAAGPLAAAAPVDGEEAERALKAALASLQRISGAA